MGFRRLVRSIDWIQLALAGDGWLAFVNRVMNFWVLTVELRDRREVSWLEVGTVIFSRSIVLHGVLFTLLVASIVQPILTATCQTLLSPLALPVHTLWCSYYITAVANGVLVYFITVLLVMQLSWWHTTIGWGYLHTIPNGNTKCNNNISFQTSWMCHFDRR
jgi:hypothetical protein